MKIVEDPRRRLVVQWLSAAAALGFAPARARAQSLFSPRPGRLPPEQSIYRLKGEVRVNDRAADLKTSIRAGDSVDTGRDGELVFVVGGNAMILRAGSRLVIDPPPQPTERAFFIVTGLRLITGGVLSVSRRQPMRLETAVATIGIRGTGFYVESDPQETYFCTCYGSTEVASKLDPTSRVEVVSQAHDQPLYVLSDAAAGNNIRSAPFKNHSDDELALIETLVGYAAPPGRSSYRYPGAWPYP